MRGVANQLLSLNVKVFVSYPTLCQQDTEVVITNNKTAATAWRQRNTDWWSEMKTAKHDTFPLAKAMDKATDLDDKAAG